MTAENLLSPGQHPGIEVSVETGLAQMTAYIERRLQEGKTRREANRCLKRYLTRNLYRLLKHGAPPAT